MAACLVLPLCQDPSWSSCIQTDEGLKDMTGSVKDLKSRVLVKATPAGGSQVAQRVDSSNTENNSWVVA